MRPYGLYLAVLLTIAIRIMLLAAAPGLTYDAYETLTQTQHIIETGIPTTLNLNEIAPHMPLFHYVLAIVSLFIPLELAALILPNVFAIGTPIAVYFLAKETTRNYVAPQIAALASAFAPLIFSDILQASPLSLAIPLFLLTYYFFIRLGKTPREQIAFIVSLVLLTATHPISMALIPAMILTLLLTRTQKTKFERSLAEATLFTSFFLIWANMLIYKETLQRLGLQALISIPEPITVTTLATFVGIVPLIAGVIAAMHYLSTERNTAVHAIVALSATTLMLIASRTINQEIGMLIVSLSLCALIAPAYIQLIAAKHRSRVPGMYNALFVLFVAVFFITSAIPAIAIGISSYAETPTQSDHETLQKAQDALSPHSTVYWDAQRGHLVTYYGFQTPLTTSTHLHPLYGLRKQQLQDITSHISDIRIIETLNTYGVDAIILPENHELPISDRCFNPLLNKNPEVYRVRCIVQ